jgi:hypothetical protein
MAERRYNEMTPERLACLRVVKAAGGSIDHEHPDLAPFCDDASTLGRPDVFNQCHDAGWLRSGYDDRFDSSTAYLTKEGRAALVGSPSHPEVKP